MGKKNLFGTFYHLFECLQVLPEGQLADIGRLVGGIGFAANKTFIYLQVARFFQAFKVAGQIAIGYLQQFLQIVVIHFVVHHQAAHDTQSYAAVKSFIEVGNIYFIVQNFD